jgi:hypothetical protein
MTPYFDITHKIKQELRKDLVRVPKFPDGYVEVVVYDPTTKFELQIMDTNKDTNKDTNTDTNTDTNMDTNMDTNTNTNTNTNTDTDTSNKTAVSSKRNAPLLTLQGTLSYDVLFRQHRICGTWDYENSNLRLVPAQADIFITCRRGARYLAIAQNLAQNSLKY